MKEFFGNNKRINITISIIVLMSMIIGFLFHSQVLGLRARERAVEALMEGSRQEMKAAGNSINLLFDTLNIYSKIFQSEAVADDNSAKEIINKIKNQSSFSEIGIVLSDGTAYTNLGREFNAGRYDFFDAAENGERTFQLMSDEKGGAEKVFVLAVPTQIGGHRAKVFGICTEKYMQYLFQPIFFDGGESFLCNSSGEILLADGEGGRIVDGAGLNNKSIFEILVHSKILDASIQDIEKNVKTSVRGTARVDMGGAKKHLVYQPVGVNDWIIVSFLPEVNDGYTNKINNYQLLIVTVSTLLVAVFLFMINRRYRKNIQKSNELLKQSELNAENQREKLLFALKQSPTYVWEYDIARNCIMYDTENGLITIDDVPNFYIQRKEIHPDDQSAIMDMYNRIDSGEPYAATEVRIADDNENGYIWHKIEYATIFDDSGKPIKAIGVSNDISAQKYAEQRYANEIAFRKLSDQSILISYCINLTKDLILDCKVNNNLLDKLADFQSFDELCGFITASILNSKEREKVIRELNTDFLIGIFEKGETTYNIEYRRKLGSGIVRWIAVTANIMRSPTSEDIIGFVYTRDISKTKIIELTSRITLIEEYEYVACLDMDADIVYAVKVDADINIAPKIEEEKFSERLERLSKGELRINEEQKKLLSIKGIEKRLEHSDSYSIFYEIPDDYTNTRRKKVHYTYLDREQRLVLLNRSDVTDIYNDERNRNDMLYTALAEAEHASRARGDFLAHMSHEIRTPLNGIRGMLDIIKDNPKENLEVYIDKAIISAKHLTGLINDILDMSKIDSGKMGLAEDWFTIGEFVEYIEAIIEPLAEEKEIKFVSRFAWGGYGSLFTDAGRLKQICINLLSNAIKYTPSGGKVEYDLSLTPAGEETAMLEVRVKDNGIGMDEEFLKHAFEPFTQAKRAADSNGTGLGLCITKSLVELMRGTLTVKSALGSGTQIGFCVEVPARLIGADRIIRETASSMFMGRRALVVDDHEINRIIAEKLLASFGLEVSAAVDGQDAVNQFKAMPSGYYDVIFMDIMMPIKDGLTATREIRALKRDDAATVEIVAMTANAFAEDIHKSIETGMNYHLSKPFDREQMLALLRKIFDDRCFDNELNDIM